MRTTTHLGLSKPDRIDKYDLNVFNGNLHTLDDQLGLMGGARGATYTNVANEVIIAMPGATINSAHGTSVGRIGYIRVTFRITTDIDFTAIGRIIGGPRKVGVLTPQYVPIAPTNMQSADMSNWGCEGVIDHKTGEVSLSSVSVRPGITKIPKDTLLQLASAKYVLKEV